MDKNLKKLAGKKIAILGLGIENQALLRYFLRRKIGAEITICDKRIPGELGDKFIGLVKKKNIKWQLGESFNQELYKFDMLFRAPGWPISCPGIREAFRKGRTTLSSPMKLFFEFCPTKNIIGVTGTKGKGTTSSLVQAMLKAGKKRVWLGGNIGVAPFAFLEKIKKSDWVVLELSSFQLEDMEASPHIAIFTNFYSEHLAPADPNNPNFHKNLKAYREAKLNIARWQERKDYLVINKNIGSRIMNYGLKGKISTFSFNNKKSDCYFVENKKISIHNSVFSIHTSLLGEHNKENIAAAAEAARIAGVMPAEIARAVTAFKGLEYRLQEIGYHQGVRYFNDSFATTPESAITALKSFKEPIVLLAGGADKGADFGKLAREIKKRVKAVVLLRGAATPRIRQSLVGAGFGKERIRQANSIIEAVAIARRQAKPGEAVLLSTGCASFGMFKNYKERGRLFNEAVADLK